MQSRLRRPLVEERPRRGLEQRPGPSGRSNLTLAQADYIAGRNQALRRLEWLGVTAEDFDARYEQLSERFGARPARGDVYWSFAVQLANAHAGDYHVTKQLRHGMARHLHNEGRSWFRQSQLALEDELLGTKETLEHFGPGSGIVIAAADYCCDACKVFDGASFDVDVALELMPLPSPDCIGNPCRCSWNVQLS